MDVKGKRHTIQVSVAIDNVLNLLSSSWGLVSTPARPILIRFLGYEQPHTAGTTSAPVATVGPSSTLGLPWAATTGRPVYAFDLQADNTPLGSTYLYDTSVNGRWQLQLGFRYIF